MGFLESVRAQFRPQQDSHSEADEPTTLGKAPASELAEPSAEKVGFNDSVSEPANLSEGGVAKVEAAQAVFGKNGKLFIILG